MSSFSDVQCLRMSITLSSWSFPPPSWHMTAKPLWKKSLNSGGTRLHLIQKMEQLNSLILIKSNWEHTHVRALVQTRTDTLWKPQFHQEVNLEINISTIESFRFCLCKAIKHTKDININQIKMCWACQSKRFNPLFFPYRFGNCLHMDRRDISHCYCCCHLCCVI